LGAGIVDAHAVDAALAHHGAGAVGAQRDAVAVGAILRGVALDVGAGIVDAGGRRAGADLAHGAAEGEAGVVDAGAVLAAEAARTVDVGAGIGAHRHAGGVDHAVAAGGAVGLG